MTDLKNPGAGPQSTSIERIVEHARALRAETLRDYVFAGANRIRAIDRRPTGAPETA